MIPLSTSARASIAIFHTGRLILFSILEFASLASRQFQNFKPKIVSQMVLGDRAQGCVESGAMLSTTAIQPFLQAKNQAILGNLA